LIASEVCESRAEGMSSSKDSSPIDDESDEEAAELEVDRVKAKDISDDTIPVSHALNESYLEKKVNNIRENRRLLKQVEE
jgi:hypothetical protein